MFLVTGGDDGSWDHSDTTETFDPLVGSWVASGAKLPRPMYYLRAVNINDRLLIFGGTDKDRNSFDDILEYDPEQDAMIPVGHMIKARAEPAVSVVPADDYLQW